MTMRELNLGDLEHLDGGRVAEAFKTQLGRLLADCEDRPGLEVARTLNMTMDITPKVDKQGANFALDDCKVKFKFAGKVPPSESRDYEMKARRRNTEGRLQRSLVFNDLSDDNVSQMTLDGAGPEDEPGTEHKEL